MPQLIPFAGTVGGWLGATGTAAQIAAAGGSAILSAASAATAAGVALSSSGTAKAADKKASAEAEKVRKEAEQKSLMETQQEDKTKAARRSLLETPTSGFGPNKNLARSFLTTL